MNKKVSRIIALVVVLCMIFTTVAFAAPKDKRFEHFNKKYELKEENYELALKALIEKQIVKGYGNGNYGMSGNVKRGDVIVMLIRMLDNYDKKYNISLDEIKSAFNDVYDNEYFAESIAKAKKIGIAKGDGKYFNPNKPITVQEVIWLVERTGEELGLVFDDENIDYLEEAFSDRLDKFAKRQEVFLMLYYLIEGYELDDDRDEEELTVEFTLKEGENEVFFTAANFKDAFNKYADENELDDDELDFITFTHSYNYLSYGKKEVSIEKNQEYYVEGKSLLIDNIKFTRTDDKASKTTIPFKAYDDEGNDPYEGTIIVTIEKYASSVKDIEFNILEGEELQFNKDRFDSSIDTIQFNSLPDEDDGILYYNSTDRKVDTDDEYLYSRIGRIFFAPEKDFDGKIEFNYTAATKDNKTITSKIVINLLKVVKIGEIEAIEMKQESRVTIEFTDQLKSQLDDKEDVELNVIDYVRFIKPTEGLLYISGAKLNPDTEYSDMVKLEEIQYRASDVEPDDLEFYAVDLNKSVAYKGTIAIEFED